MDINFTDNAIKTNSTPQRSARLENNKISPLLAQRINAQNNNTPNQQKTGSPSAINSNTLTQDTFFKRNKRKIIIGSAIGAAVAAISFVLLAKSGKLGNKCQEFINNIFHFQVKNSVNEGLKTEILNKPQETNQVGSVSSEFFQDMQNKIDSCIQILDNPNVDYSIDDWGKQCDKLIAQIESIPDEALEKRQLLTSFYLKLQEAEKTGKINSALYQNDFLGSWSFGDVCQRAIGLKREYDLGKMSDEDFLGNLNTYVTQCSKLVQGRKFAPTENGIPFAFEAMKQVTQKEIDKMVQDDLVKEVKIDALLHDVKQGKNLCVHYNPLNRGLIWENIKDGLCALIQDEKNKNISGTLDDISKIETGIKKSGLKILYHDDPIIQSDIGLRINFDIDAVPFNVPGIYKMFHNEYGIALGHIGQYPKSI